MENVLVVKMDFLVMIVKINVKKVVDCMILKMKHHVIKMELAIIVKQVFIQILVKKNVQQIVMDHVIH